MSKFKTIISIPSRFATASSGDDPVAKENLAPVAMLRYGKSKAYSIF